MVRNSVSAEVMLPLTRMCRGYARAVVRGGKAKAPTETLQWKPMRW